MVLLDYRRFSPGLKDIDHNFAFPIIIIWNLHVLGETRHFAKKSTWLCGAILIRYCISQFWKTKNYEKILVEVNIIIWQLFKQVKGLIIQYSYIDFHTKSTLFFIHPEWLFISQKTAGTKTKIDMNIILVKNRTTNFHTLCLFLSRKIAGTHV